MGDLGLDGLGLFAEGFQQDSGDPDSNSAMRIPISDVDMDTLADNSIDSEGLYRDKIAISPPHASSKYYVHGVKFGPASKRRCGPRGSLLKQHLVPETSTSRGPALFQKSRPAAIDLSAPNALLSDFTSISPLNSPPRTLIGSYSPRQYSDVARQASAMAKEMRLAKDAVDAGIGSPVQKNGKLRRKSRSTAMPGKLNKSGVAARLTTTSANSKSAKSSTSVARATKQTTTASKNKTSSTAATKLAANNGKKKKGKKVAISAEERRQRRSKHNEAERLRTRTISLKIIRLHELLHEGGHSVKNEKLHTITEGLEYLKQLTRDVAEAKKVTWKEDTAGRAGRAGRDAVGSRLCTLRHSAELPSRTMEATAPFALLDSNLRVLYCSPLMSDGLRSILRVEKLDFASIFSLLYAGSPRPKSTATWRDLKTVMQDDRRRNCRATLLDFLHDESTHTRFWFRVSVTCVPLADGTRVFNVALLPQVGPPATSETVGGDCDPILRIEEQQRPDYY